MQYDLKTLQALAIMRDGAAHSDDISNRLARAFNTLDKAGVFAALDEQSGMAEAERHMEAIRKERAARCTCSARKAGMQDTDIHVLGCPAIDVPSRGAGQMDCPSVMPNQCPTCRASHFKDADALQYHIDVAH